MPRWYDLIPAAGTWLGRFYGVAILALGAVSLYWGTRGFLALLHGIRADWSDPRACGIALVIAGLSFWAAYHLLQQTRYSSVLSKPPSSLTNPALARDFARGGKSRDGFGRRSIRRNLVTVALLTGVGVLLVVGGDAVVGAAMFLSGLIYLAFAWHFRHDIPLDPEVDTAIQQALKLERRDPGAEQHLTELRNRATYDRRAAVELRNLLRAKLKLNEDARRRAQRSLANSPHGAAVIEALARTADTTRQRLLEAQQYVDRHSGL